jgi:hypothetical protein
MELMIGNLRKTKSNIETANSLFLLVPKEIRNQHGRWTTVPVVTIIKKSRNTTFVISPEG